MDDRTGFHAPAGSLSHALTQSGLAHESERTVHVRRAGVLGLHCYTRRVINSCEAAAWQCWLVVEGRAREDACFREMRDAGDPSRLSTEDARPCRVHRGAYHIQDCRGSTWLPCLLVLLSGRSRLCLGWLLSSVPVPLIACLTTERSSFTGLGFLFLLTQSPRSRCLRSRAG